LYPKNYILILFICILHFSLLFSGLLHAESNEFIVENKHSNFSAIEFELVDGFIVIPASVDGVHGDYIFDTGAPNTLINQNVINGEFTLWTANGDLKSKELSLQNFKCGDIKKRKLEAWAVNLSFVEDVIQRPLAGIIGADVLLDHKVLVDYENSQLILMSSDTKNLTIPPAEYNIVSLPFLLDHGQIAVVEAVVKGKISNFVFDTGAGVSVLHSNILTGQEQQKELLANHDIILNQVRIQNVSFISKSIDDLNKITSQKIDGILSVSSLNASKVLLDYYSSKIHVFWKKKQS